MYILDVDSNRLKQQLAEVIAKAPKLFDKAPIVLDCSAIDLDKFDIQSACQILREQGLIPVAIQGGNPLIETIAQCYGLAVLSPSSSHNKPLRKNKTTTIEKNQVMTETIKSKLLTTPVRSGQQVVSKGGDLVITASVSHGAELLADGNIHIYGALRGRALAGISGNKQARIFCQSLEAELVSIAGFYRLSDAIEPITGPCQIFLKNDHIQIELI